jgi:hypothetical protein
MPLLSEQDQVDQLYTLVYLHKHRDELLHLMQEQVNDDTENCLRIYNKNRSHRGLFETSPSPHEPSLSQGFEATSRT